MELWKSPERYTNYKKRNNNHKIKEKEAISIKDYFKGRYFKCSNKDKTIAFIPAFHSSNYKKTASLQIITDNETFHIAFDFSEYREKSSTIRLGNSLFSNKGIRLNIETNDLTAHGILKFSSLSPIRYDIMGPFKFVPFMQCRHSVFSMKHLVNGKITVNGQTYEFQNGIGYIEGDRGYSFPKRYIWTQCGFNDGSLMLSVADIPLFNFHFTGIIGFILLNKKEYRIATYLGAKVKYIGNHSVIVKQGKYTLTAKLIQKNPFPLYAPENGKMSRTIHESASCKAYYCFSDNDNILCEFTSDMASFEYEINVVV